MSQLAAAPTARADDFSDIVANVEANIADAQTEFTTAQSDFALDTPTGFAAGVAADTEAADNVLIAPTEDILAGGVQAAAGQAPTGVADFDGAIADPASLVDLQVFLSEDSAIGTTLFNIAEGEFGIGTPDGFADGVTASLAWFDVDVIAQQQGFIGVADLLGL
jgi:hypothetical protein